MKKIIAFFLFFNLTIFSQINFEKGYVIDNSNTKIECLIKNYDWKYNPDEIEYRLADNSNTIKLNFHDIKEFGIGENIKYIKALVDIDKSSEDINHLSHERNPKFEHEEILLKVLVEGKANLYRYCKSGLIRFFFKTDNLDITQLVFKSYQNFGENLILQNIYFKQQLLNTISCDKCSKSDFENLEYESESLMTIFKKYNSDFIQNIPSHTKEDKKDILVFSLKSGVGVSTLNVTNFMIDDFSIKFGSVISYSLGTELEYILPFNNNKWSLYIEPYYQNFKFEKTENVSSISGGKIKSSLNYHSLELPIGLRHYFFLNKDSKIFVNARYELNYALTSNFKNTRTDGSLINESFKLSPGNNLGIGAGYKFRNKYSIELVYQLNRNLFTDRVYWQSGFNKLSFVLGYTLF